MLSNGQGYQRRDNNMTDHDKEEFAEIWSATYNLYSKQITVHTLAIVYETLSRFDIKQIRTALTKHIQSPETGQFCPKPADVIKQIEGNSGGRATNAWSEVLYAIHHVGAWSSIKFEDHLIHYVIEKIGGWISICKLKESELAFKQKEFINHYQYLLSQPTHNATTSILKGIIDCQKNAKSQPLEYVLLGKNKQITQHRQHNPHTITNKELSE